MFKVKGSERFIWKTSGRHDTCGHTSHPVGPGRVVLGHHLLVVRVALDRQQRRPGEGPADLTLEREHLLVGEDAAREQGHHAAPGLRDRLQQGAQLGQVGHPGRDGPAAVAVVGGRRARGEAGGPARHGLGHHGLHAADLVVGGRPLVRLLAHDVEAHRGVPDVAAEVERGAAPRRRRRGTAGRSRTRPRAHRPRACRSSCPPRAAACAPAGPRRRDGWGRWRTRSCRRPPWSRRGRTKGSGRGPRTPARRSGCGCR